MNNVLRNHPLQGAGWDDPVTRTRVAVFVDIRLKVSGVLSHFRNVLAIELLEKAGPLRFLERP